MIIAQVFVFNKTYHLVLANSVLLHPERASSIRPRVHFFKAYSFVRCFPTTSFSGNMILFLRREKKDDLSQKMHGNMTFSVYSIKMVFLFPTNMLLSFCQKSKDNLLPKKIYLGMTFPVSLKKMIFILENVVFLLIGKLKMIKKFSFIKKLQ